MSSSKIIEQSYQELVKRTRTKTNVVKGKVNDNKCGEIWVRRNDEEEEISTLLKTTTKAINSLSNSGKVYQNNDKQLQSILKVKSSNNQNSKRSNKEQVIWLKQKEFAVDESSEIENSNNTQSDWESVSSGSYYLGDNRANRQICGATAFQPSSTDDDDDENDDTQSVRSFSSQPTNSNESRSSLTSADSVSLSSQLSPRLATSTVTATATARTSCIKNVRFVLNNKNDDISACQKAVEMSSAKNKSNKQNTKRVDFLDSKISSLKSNLLNDNHCSILLGTTHKKLKCLSANSSTTSTNKLELEQQQQQQQQSISSSPPPGVSAYNEDLSLADSNISSYSSEVHCSSSSSSSSSSCTKRPTKLITTPPQPTTPTQKQVVAAVTITSSTTSSSGVGSSNISSASSTTSETPSTENLINPTTRHQTPSSINTNRHSIATTTSTSSSYKVAPKAVILDGDGDIEIEIPKTVTTSQPPQLPLTNPPEHKQIEQPRLRKSAAFFKSPERVDDEMRKASHRNSNYLITSRDNFNHLQLMHLQQQYQQQQQQQQQKQFYQTNVLQREYNNRLAAAAAAAAEMDKERQKGALLEYVKSQQLKQQQQQQMKIRQHQQYDGDQSRKYPPAENTITQPYSNILPRKQINSANRKELDFAIAASKAANNENQARAISLRCQSSNSSNHNHNQNQNTAANRATIFVFNQQQKPQQQTTASKPNSSSSASTSSTASSSSAASTSSASSTSSSGGEGYDHPIMSIHHPKTAAGQFFVSMQQRPTSKTTVIKTTPAKQRNDSLGLCYLMYGPETKRTLLPSQVTGIDTVKALFVRAFPDKLTMNYLDDEQLVKIYIKDQLKDLFYQLDDMNDIKDRCVLKLVELKAAINSSQLSLTSNCTLTNNNQPQHQNGTIKKNQSSNSSTTATTFTNCYGYESSVNLANAAASNSTDQNGNGVDQTYHYYGGAATSQQPQKQPNQDDSNLLLSSSAIHRSLSEPRPQSMIDVGQYQQQQQQQQQPNHIQLTQSNFTSPISPQSAYIQQQQGYINDPRIYMRSKPHHMKMIETVPEYYVTEGSPSNSNGHIVGGSVETYDNLEANGGGHQSRIDANGRFVQAMPPPPPPPPPPPTSAANQRLQELQYNYYDRYNNQMRPIYNSVRIANHQRDIKSVDRDPIYAQVLANGMVNGVEPSTNSRAYKTQVMLNGGQTNNAVPNNRSHVLMGVSAAAQKPYSSVSAAYTSHKHRQSLLNVPFMSDSRGVTRDIRSCEREYALADLSLASSSSSKSGSNNKSKSRNVAESVNNTTLSIDEETSNDKNGEETGSEQIPTIEITRESRKATKPTAKRTNYTEEDEENYPSETEVETTNDPTTTNGMDEDMDRTINDNKSEQDIFDDASSTTAVINYQGQQNNGEVLASDETPDDSKAKIALMQKQLQQLTELVQSALVNRDFSQLVVAANTHLNFNGHAAAKHQQQKSPIKKQQQQQQRKVELSALNQKTNSIRSDLNGIKRMQENFSSSFGASIKSFVNELNDKLKMFCLNEINEKFRLDLIVQKYQLDSSKIEHELSDLECVVDDLRESILKHKCKVSIDDVECYALALSQLSKQLVGLKTSFSGIKDQFRIQLNNNQKSENNDVAYEWQNRFLSVESCKLDMIIKRCKRITGILIVLKKLAITSRSQQSLKPIKINEMKRSSSPSSQSPPSLANDSLVADDEKTSEIEQKRAQDAIDQLKKIQLLKEIESLKPDHEQRQLAIEESELTMKKRNQYRAKKSQLKEEKEQQQQQQNKQNQATNSTLSSSPSSFSSQSSSASSSASSSPKLIPNGQQLQIVDTTSISIEPVVVNRLGNTTSIQVVQVNGKSSANVLPTTTTLPQTVISKTNGIDRQSYLETVHEEDVPTTNVPEQSQSESQQTSEQQQQQNVEKVKSSISIQPNVEPTTEPTSTNSATFTTNNNTETTSSLYQQLNDLKPIRATRNFKSSTCICLNIKEPLITDSASAVVSSCSMLITTPTISEKNGVELSSNETNGNINGVSNEASAKLAPSCLSFPTSKTNSTTYISLNKSSPVASSKSISLRVNELKAAAGVNGDETSSPTSSTSSSTSSSNVISRRNSSFLPSTTSSYTVNNSINLNGGGNSNAPRRVSLSVTDL